MQGMQANQGQIHGRESRLVRTVKGQGRFMKLAAIVFISFLIPTLGCASLQTKDEISNLSFSHDGKKVLFDRWRGESCQIQVYDLETGELAAYQSPAKERWTMARQSYDGKHIVFAIMPIIDGGLELGDMQIAVMDADGRNRRTITTGPGAKIYPVFSHSGAKVLYARAAFMRTQGRTPAADYDAWEVDLATGSQTQLTSFKYFYMDSLSYYPDDERFIYYGELPRAFPGLDLSKINPMQAQESIRQEQIKQKIGLSGVIRMKKGDALPQENLDFGTGFLAKRPLLSKDGSTMIVEKDMSAGKFYLYSPDGKHRLICNAGSVDSVAISPDGEYFGTGFPSNIFITRISDGGTYRTICVRRTEDWDEKVRKNPSWRLLPDQPSRIVKR